MEQELRSARTSGEVQAASAQEEPGSEAADKEAQAQTGLDTGGLSGPHGAPQCPAGEQVWLADAFMVITAALRLASGTVGEGPLSSNIELRNSPRKHKLMSLVACVRVTDADKPPALLRHLSADTNGLLHLHSACCPPAALGASWQCCHQGW